MSKSLIAGMLRSLKSARQAKRTTGRVRLRLEGLDSRRVPAAITATLSNTGILHVEGTDAKDQILIQVRGDKLTVGRTQIEVAGVNQSSVLASSVTSVEVNGLGGNDIIELRNIHVSSTVHAGDGNDVVYGGFASDQIFGGLGNDRLFGRGGDDKLNGEAGDDRMHGGDGNDDLAGEAGDDRVNGNRGNDRVEGNDGDDSMTGGVGDDSMFGGAGDDRGSGESGDDNIFGESGNDTLSGGSDDDSLNGDDGDDRLNGNGGSDDCQGGLGDDDVRGDDHGGGVHAASEVEGTITAIDLAASTVTIQTQAGTSVVVNVGASTIIERNGEHTTLATFVVGDPGEAKFDAQGNTLKIEAGVDDNGGGGGGQQNRVEGIITAIDLVTSKVTVKTQSGTTVEIAVAASTKIERNDLHTTLASFKVGDKCEARFDDQGNTLKIEALGT